MNNITQHPTIVAANDLIAICKPLQTLNIDYFSHVRIDHNGQFSAVATDPRFTEHYFRNHYYNADIHAAEKKMFGKYIVWDAMTHTGQTAAMLRAASEMGHRHNFTITQKSSLGDEFYHFATRVTSESINQVYINNIDLLERFIEYFHHRVVETDVLVKAYDIKFSVDSSAAGYTILPSQSMVTSQHRMDFLAAVQADNKETLSPQLLLCLQHLIEGNTAKQIAIKMHLSYRTVEHHIAKIRKLTGCRNSKELIAAYAERKWHLPLTAS